MGIYILLFITILIYLFFTLNSIVWLKDKDMHNINDKIVKYLIYINFIIFSLILLVLLYFYTFNKNIIIE
jgi:hypothetical protein